jgi:hypothetical protein
MHLHHPLTHQEIFGRGGTHNKSYGFTKIPAKFFTDFTIDGPQHLGKFDYSPHCSAFHYALRSALF